jgi:hypothetical protein
VGFLAEWQRYVQMVEERQWREAKLDQTKLDKMSGEHTFGWMRLDANCDRDADEQVAQLYELLNAIRNDGAAGPATTPDAGASTKKS